MLRIKDAPLLLRGRVSLTGERLPNAWELYGKIAEAPGTPMTCQRARRKLPPMRVEAR